MEKKYVIIGAVALIVIVVLGIYFYPNKDSNQNSNTTPAATLAGEGEYIYVNAEEGPSKCEAGLALIPYEGIPKIIGKCVIQTYAPENNNDSQTIEDPTIDLDIFVSNANFPEQQDTRIILENTENGVKIFSVKYGAPQDCPSGCFYSMALGIQNNDKFGWIIIEDYDNIGTSNLPIYDFNGKDEYLYTEEFFNEFKESYDWGYQNGFLPLVAKDVDTSNGTLLRIANGLSSYIQPSLAKALLENEEVQSNKEILTIISSLPVFSGDAYSEVRKDAQDLIDQEQINEDELNLCSSDSDCVVVSYNHCCGSTKRAINKEYISEYNNNPEWQKYDNPETCAMIGICAEDSDVDFAECDDLDDGTKRCQLVYPI